MYELPTSVIIHDTEYEIRNKGDYRMVIDCLTALGDVELTEKERLIASLIIFYDGFNDIDDLNQFDINEAIKRMYEFFNCGSNPQGARVNYKVMDWEQDSQLIVSAINNVAKQEIRSQEYIHWWTFMGYYMSIGDCTFSHIVGIRYKLLKGNKLEKYEQEFRKNNPQYFIWNSKTLEQQEAEEWLNQVWNT